MFLQVTPHVTWKNEIICQISSSQRNYCQLWIIMSSSLHTHTRTFLIIKIVELANSEFCRFFWKNVHHFLPFFHNCNSPFLKSYLIFVHSYLPNIVIMPHFLLQKEDNTKKKIIVSVQ